VPVARLATVGPDGQPHLVPVTFAVDGDDIYTAVDAKPKSSRQLRRLRNIAGNPRVAVLADHYQQDWDSLWWVRADGHASILTEPAELARPLRLLAGRYPQYRASPPDGPVIHILAAHPFAVGLTRWLAGAHAATSRMPIAASPRPARCTQRRRSPSTTLASSTVIPG
jgi:PPOX class probable F420-dependent enzyme